MPTCCAFGVSILPCLRSSSQSPACTCHSRHVPTASIAIVGTVPSTFASGILSPDVLPTDISLKKAIEQHAEYCHALSKIPAISGLYQSPSNPAFPDGVFVEDPLVIISKRTAFMPTAGHESRDGEGAALTSVLKRIGVVVRHAWDIRLDGGDVLKVPGFVVVGISERTESASVEALQAALDDDAAGDKRAPKVVPVAVVDELHLKSLVTWVGGVDASDHGFLVAPDDERGKQCLKRIQEATGMSWDVLQVPEEESLSANVLFIPPRKDKYGSVARGAVFVQKSCPTSVKLLKEKVVAEGMEDIEVVAVDMSEMAKANGALTCMSVII